MDQKTILYLRPDYSKEKLIAGGSVSHTIGVIEGLLMLGYNVIVASAVMVEQYSGLAIEHVQPLTIPKSLQWLKWKISCIISNIFFTAQCYSLLKKRKVEYIYQRYAVLNCTGVLLSRWFKVPLILEYNCSEVWLDLHWAPKKFIKLTWVLRLFEWINIHCADQIVVVSKPLEDELISRGVRKSKIVVNPNGVNTTRLDPVMLQEARNDIRKKLDIEGSFVFGFVGTFSQWHGINILVAMIPEVLKKRPNAHFLLIGDGDLLVFLKKELHRYIAEKKVTCTGLVRAAQAQEYLSACDAFLSPTQPNADGTPFFGSPTKLFEYLSMGKPVLASDLNQVAEVIFPAFKIDDIKEDLDVQAQLGIIVPPQDVNAFINAACKLVDCRPEQRSCMGANAREKAISCYSWKNHVERIMAQWHSN